MNICCDPGWLASLGSSFVFGLTLALVAPRRLAYMIVALLPFQWLFIPVAGFYITPVDPLVAAGLLAFAFRVLRGSSGSLRALKTCGVLLVFLASYAASFHATSGIPRTWFRMVLAAVPALLLTEALESDGQRRAAIGFLAAAGCVAVLWGAVGLPSAAPPEAGRFAGTSNPNFTALLLFSGAVSLLPLVERSVVRLSVVVILTGFGFATFSRAGIIALIGSLAMVVWPSGDRRTRGWAVGIAAAAVLVLGIGLPSDRTLTWRERRAPAGSERAVDTVPESGAAAAAVPERSGGQLTSVGVRLRILSAAWNAFRENPLTGIGIGRFRPYTNSDPALRKYTGGLGTVTENSYLDVLVEGGLLPFVAFMACLGGALWGGRAVTVGADRRQASVASASLAGLAVLAIGALFANLVLQYQLWAALGLVWASTRAAPESGVPA